METKQWGPGKQSFYLSAERAKALSALGVNSTLEAIDRLIALSASNAQNAPTTPPESDQVSESSGSPFRPVCIWPNIKHWYKSANDEWVEEEYDCPIRLEDRSITVAELSKSHCTKCPIFRTYEIKQRKRGGRARSRSAERYPSSPLSGGVGFNGAQAIGWSAPR